MHKENKAIAFALASLRFDYVEGSKTSPVSYLEAIFVKEEFRRKSYASSLLKACQLWALEQGSLEFASDCESKNLASIKFHKAMGFDITNHLICFIKKLR
ncbi:GNAT family N-acetyltransferase [Campylobacter sp. TTU-622]|uniref:GNAT family N-acetyltransferase n=1 Tax=Campylobacter sp. TTU-622 TaxID=2800583 RepID=UPI001907D5EA|nr:GNAT family N-acetyltransferase [Campylobacter sp. TTU-622]MBK1972711.1 GNAT family N-acetyltransferase [Campylobacter sp. TTU-622]